MTYSAPIKATDLFVEMSDAAILAALKLQMEGLAALFGTSCPPQAKLVQSDADTEAAFDNLPV